VDWQARYPPPPQELSVRVISALQEVCPARLERAHLTRALITAFSGPPLIPNLIPNNSGSNSNCWEFELLGIVERQQLELLGIVDGIAVINGVNNSNRLNC
jgi:hypothetical protein